MAGAPRRRGPAAGSSLRRIRRRTARRQQPRVRLRGPTLSAPPGRHDSARGHSRTLAHARSLTCARSLMSCGDRAILDGVSGKPSEIAREGWEAWRNGDFDTIQEILDPNV